MADDKAKEPKKSAPPTFEELRAEGKLHQIEPSELVGFEQMSEYLLAILNGACYVLEEEGELILIEKKEQVDRIHGLSIQIYPDEHPPPHFHVRTNSINASFTIDGCDLHEGQLSSADKKKVRYWFGLPGNQELLQAKWEAMRPTDCTVDKHAKKPDP